MLYSRQEQKQSCWPSTGEGKSSPSIQSIPPLTTTSAPFPFPLPFPFQAEELPSSLTQAPEQSAPPAPGSHESRGSSTQTWSLLGHCRLAKPPQTGPLNLTQRPGQSAMRLHSRLLGSAMQYWSAAQGVMPRLPQGVEVGLGG